jgi:antitoxin VapB
MNAARHVKLFRNGRNQAVRIPREFELRGDSAVMRKEGDRLVIESLPEKPDIRSLLEQWRKEPPLGDEEALPEADDQPPEPFDL